jgi:hypothetical protein
MAMASASLVVTVQTLDAPARDVVFRTSPVRVGRGADNDLCLPFPFVSDHHGEVHFDDASASYLDLGSTNGTLVHGQRIASRIPVPIVERLVVVIGSLTLAFRHTDVEGCRAPISSPAAPAVAAGGSLFPGSARQGPEPAAGAEREGERRRHSPPTLFPDSLERDDRAAGNLPRNRLAPPTLFPPGPPAREPGPVFPVGDGQEPRLAPPVGVPSMRAETAGAGLPTRASLRPPAGPATEPNPTSSPPASAASPSASGGLPAGAVAADQVRRLQKLTRVMCEELVRLRKACEAFGRETGIRPFPLSEGTRMHDLQDGEELARYLTSSLLSEARLDELKKLFADLAAHQLALMGAILEGARGALHNVDPQNAGASKPRLAIFEDRRWNEYVERFAGFVEDDERLQAAVFGPEFADAYAAARGV